MLRGKPPIPDTLSQSQIGEKASSSRFNYTGENRNSSSAEAAWTRRRNTPMRVATEQSTRLVLPGSQNRVGYCTIARCALELFNTQLANEKGIICTWLLVTKGWRMSNLCRNVVSRFLNKFWTRPPSKNLKLPTFFLSQEGKQNIKHNKSQSAQWCCCGVISEKNLWPWTCNLFTLHTQT